MPLQRGKIKSLSPKTCLARGSINVLAVYYHLPTVLVKVVSRSPQWFCMV